MEKLCAVVLAAGDGKRMHSARPKVLCEVLFRPMIGWIADTLAECGIEQVCAVLGAGADQVRAAVPQFSWVEQKERLGTGHAVMQARDFLQSHRGGDCAVLYGDAPFVDAGTLTGAYRLHKESGAAITLLTASLPDPTGYGRIVRDARGDVARIVEQADADEKTRQIREINAGTYWFSVDFLLRALQELQPNNAQGEYYLTDVIGIAADWGERVCGYEAPDNRIAMGANDRKGLLYLNQLARQAELERQMDAGVEIVCDDGIIIQPGVQIGQDTVVLPGTILKGKTVIGKNCVIGPNTVIVYPRAAGQPSDGRGKDRQLCGGKKRGGRGKYRRGPSDLCGGQRRGQKRQLRLRHGDRQFRRARQIPHRHRGRLFYRLQQQPDRPGDHRRRQLYRRRVHHYGSGSAGRSGHRPGQTDCKARLGQGPAGAAGSAQKIIVFCRLWGTVEYTNAKQDTMKRELKT